jgi:hypothetical protein
MRRRNGLGLLSAALGAVLCLALGPGPANAQINPFGRNNRLNLTSEDFQIMGDAASALTRDAARPGQTATWDNPATGTSGTIELLETFQKDGMPCQKRRYVFNNERKFGTSTFVLNVCRIPSGEWKVVENGGAAQPALAG